MAERVKPMVVPEADERAIARELGLSRPEVELLFRHIQHRSPGLATS